MVNIDYKKGFGFMHKKHCEKVSYLTTIAFIAGIWIAILVYYNQWQYSINYFYLVIGTFISGWIGVIIYRVSNKKKIIAKETLFFWSAKP